MRRSRPNIACVAPTASIPASSLRRRHGSTTTAPSWASSAPSSTSTSAPRRSGFCGRARRVSRRSRTRSTRWCGRRGPTASTIISTSAGTDSPACRANDRRRGVGRASSIRRTRSARRIWRHSLETGEPYHIEYRCGTAPAPIAGARPRPGGARREGRITRWFGTCTDIQGHRRRPRSAGALSARNSKPRSSGARHG